MAPCWSVLVMNGAGGLLVVRFFSMERTVNGGQLGEVAGDFRQIFCRAFAFGVFGGFVLVDDQAEQFGGSAGIGFVAGLEFLAAQFDQLGEECAVLGQPFFAFDLGSLAVAGVGEEVGPLFGELFARGGIGGRR